MSAAKAKKVVTEKVVTRDYLSIGERFPVDVDKAVEGPWIDGKRPASIEMRRWLAAVARGQRADAFRELTAGERAGYLAHIREEHRTRRGGWLPHEDELHRVRDKFLRLILPFCRTAGGIQ